MTVADRWPNVCTCTRSTARDSARTMIYRKYRRATYVPYSINRRLEMDLLSRDLFVEPSFGRPKIPVSSPWFTFHHRTPHMSLDATGCCARSTGMCTKQKLFLLVSCNIYMVDDYEKNSHHHDNVPPAPQNQYVRHTHTHSRSRSRSASARSSRDGMNRSLACRWVSSPGSIAHPTTRTGPVGFPIGASCPSPNSSSRLKY
jgi:hypothetical protein